MKIIQLTNPEELKVYQYGMIHDRKKKITKKTAGTSQQSVNDIFI